MKGFTGGRNFHIRWGNNKIQIHPEIANENCEVDEVIQPIKRKKPSSGSTGRCSSAKVVALITSAFNKDQENYGDEMMDVDDAMLVDQKEILPSLSNIEWSYNDVDLFEKSLKVGGSHQHDQSVRSLVLRLVLTHIINQREQIDKQVQDDDKTHGRSIYPSIFAVANLTRIGHNQIKSWVIELFMTGSITGPVRKGGMRSITETSQVSKA